MDSIRPQWSRSQRACLAQMGFRHWQPQGQSEPTRTPESAEPVWLWPAVASAGTTGLVFVMQTIEPGPAVRRLLSDLARHFALALPGNPQPASACSMDGNTLVLGFADAGQYLEGQHTLPSLQALLDGELAARRQCWRQLSQLIVQQGQRGWQ